MNRMHQSVRATHPTLFLQFAICILQFAIFNVSAPAQAAPPGPSERDVDEAIVRALRYIAQQQQPAGGWKVDAFNGEATSATSLAVMSFLATGHTPDEGPYGEIINRGVQFVVSHQEPDGLLIHRQRHQPMYDHGIIILSMGVQPGHQSRRVRIVQPFEARWPERIKFTWKIPDPGRTGIVQ